MPYNPDKNGEPDIFVTRRLPGNALSLLDGCGFVALVHEGEEAPARDAFLTRIGSCRGLLTLLNDRVDADALDAAPRLVVVSNYAVGYDNIDLDAASRREIIVTNTPEVLTESTADLTWALILAVARRLKEAESMVAGGEWPGWHPTQQLGLELHGSTSFRTSRM